MTSSLLNLNPRQSWIRQEQEKWYSCTQRITAVPKGPDCSHTSQAAPPYSHLFPPRASTSLVPELLQIKYHQFCDAASATVSPLLPQQGTGTAVQVPRCLLRSLSLPLASGTSSCFSVTKRPICWGNFKGFGTRHQMFCTWHEKLSWDDFMMPGDRNIQTKLSDKQDFCTKQPLTQRAELVPVWQARVLSAASPSAQGEAQNTVEENVAGKVGTNKPILCFWIYALIALKSCYVSCFGHRLLFSPGHCKDWLPAFLPSTAFCHNCTNCLLTVHGLTAPNSGQKEQPTTRCSFS